MQRGQHTSEDSVRERIKEFIWKNPGTYLREIVKKLGIAMGHAQYHLEVLEEMGEVVSYKIGRYKRYYPPIFSIEDARVIGFIHIPSSRKILEALIKKGSGKLSDIAEWTNMKPQTVAFHLKILEEYGIVEKDANKVYRIKKERMKKVIEIATKGTIENLVSRFMKAFYS